MHRHFWWDVSGGGHLNGVEMKDKQGGKSLLETSIILIHLTELKRNIHQQLLLVPSICFIFKIIFLFTNIFISKASTHIIPSLHRQPLSSFPSVLQSRNSFFSVLFLLWSLISSFVVIGDNFDVIGSYFMAIGSNVKVIDPFSKAILPR